MTQNGYELIIPSSHGYGAALQPTLGLLDRHWPEHPDATVVCRELAPDLGGNLRARCYVAGLQSRVSWCSALLWYLTSWCEDEIILLLLDDYGLCGPPDLGRLDQALGVIQKNPNVASFHLTHMVVHPCRPTNHGEGIEVYPSWEYRINTQASFWRVSHLKQFLEEMGSRTIAEFEILGSGHWNKNWPEEIEHLTFRSPPGTPYILDTDPHKLGWVIPYDNLVHQGRWEQRHRAVLRELGIDPEKPLV